MPYALDFIKCYSNFSKKYKQYTVLEYTKNITDIYKKLNQYGNESKAIEIASRKRKQIIKEICTHPSNMNPCTTVDLLVKEIKVKI